MATQAVAGDGAPADGRSVDRRETVVRARVLGRFSIAVDGRRVQPSDWRRVSAAHVVKMVLVAEGHSVAREAVAEQLWPEADPDHQAANLRKAIHFARRALSSTPGAPPILAVEHGRLTLGTDATLELDLDRLRDAITVLEDRPHRSADEIAAAEDTVLVLGADELLPDDPYDDLLAALRERLSSRWRHLALEVARRRLASGGAEAARDLLDEVLLRDPADEDAHRLLIELFGSIGQHHAARRQFFRCQRELGALGVEPSRETASALGEAEAAALAQARPASAPGELVGRDAELSRLDQAFDRLGSGRLAVLVVRGPAGIGKSGLLEAVARYGRSSGLQVLEARAVESAPGLSFAPVGAALATVLRPEVVAGWPEPAASAAATLVPGLGLEPMLPFKQPRALAAAVTEVLGRLAARGPLVLLIDDGHWLDDRSADLLAEIAQRAVDLALLLAVSLRSDEPRSRAVDRLVDRLAAIEGAECLELGPLAARDIPALVVRHLGGIRVDAGLAGMLAERSSGNPLFCLELARDGRDRGTIVIEGGVWHKRGAADAESVPGSVARLVAARCRRLRPATLRVLALSAEVGDVIDYEVVARALQAEAGAVVAALDEALEASLMIEARGRYRFAHPLFRAAVQRQTHGARRGRMMLSLARTLAGGNDPGDVDAIRAAVAAGVDPVVVADRALTAVEYGVMAARSLAVGFGFAAASRQIALFDPAGARHMLQRALDAWSQLTPIEQEGWSASAAWRMLGDVVWAPDGEAAAEAAYRHAIATARGPEELGAAYRALAWMPYRHGDYESMIAIFDEAMRLHEGDELLRGILLMEAGWLMFRHQRLPESLAQLRAAEPILTSSGSEELRMQILDCLWGPLESMGQGDESVDGLHEALAIAIRLGDVSWEARIRTHIGFRMVIGGTPGRARPHLERAAHLESMIGDPYMESVSTWALAEMAYALGYDAEAEQFRRRELALLSDLGGNARHEALAHVHLVHILRRAGRSDAASGEAALAMARAATASATDPDFGRRVASYLAADRWLPMSQ